MDRGGPETAELGGPLRVSSETLGAPKALFMTVWRPSTRSAENSCGMRQRLTVRPGMAILAAAGRPSAASLFTVP